MTDPLVKRRAKPNLRLIFETHCVRSNIASRSKNELGEKGGVGVSDLIRIEVIQPEEEVNLS
jgi:hypothetical protein